MLILYNINYAAYIDDTLVSIQKKDNWSQLFDDITRNISMTNIEIAVGKNALEAATKLNVSCMMGHGVNGNTISFNPIKVLQEVIQEKV